jgi:hypothetical protein
MLYVLNFDCLCVIIACLVKESIPKEEPIVPNDLTPDDKHLARTKVSLTEPFDHTEEHGD